MPAVALSPVRPTTQPVLLSHASETAAFTAPALSAVFAPAAGYFTDVPSEMNASMLQSTLLPQVVAALVADQRVGWLASLVIAVSVVTPAEVVRSTTPPEAIEAPPIVATSTLTGWPRGSNSAGSPPTTEMDAGSLPSRHTNRPRSMSEPRMVPDGRYG